jgi:EAL domain-containing protein (putative c-di-GMP-specific phosphodiesterase class I)/CheY-like chemotaxis protein
MEVNVDNPVRVLVVEHGYTDHRIAKHMLADYDLDFSCRRVESPLELSRIAAEFDPDIVLCTDHMSMTSSHAALDAIRLLCFHAPVILVSSVKEMKSSAACNTTGVFLKSARQPYADISSQSVTHAAPARCTQDVANLRLCFSSILESSADPVVMSDSEGWITHANTSACRRLDGLQEQCLGTILGAPVDDGLRVPHWLDAARGANSGSDQYSGPFALSPSGSAPGKGQHHRLAYFDAQSGCSTPVHMHDLIGCLGARAPASGTALALVALNLDSIRISDDASAPALDDGERPVGSEPRSDARYGSIVRITADDFLLVLPDLCCPADAAITVQRVLDSMEQNRGDAFQSHERLAIGTDTALRAAGDDIARQPHDLPSERHGSMSTWRGRRPAMASADPQPAARAPFKLTTELAEALQRQALSVQYQPQYELKTGRGCGVEALARWVLSTGEIIAPATFIPAAERAGLIHDLGAWVLKSACESAVAWTSRSMQPMILSVNVSALQIDEDFSGVIGRTLKHSGFPAKLLELEITESALVKNTDLTIEYMNEWRRLGVRISVDDFGTGCSSLNDLSRLPVDRLKLDQSLVRMMALDSNSTAVVRSIVSLGAELGMDVIAEGVETELQFQMLTDLGCPRVQGYLLGRPMPAHQAQIALRKSWGNRPKATFHSLVAHSEASYAH